ncbi:hypothetical protein ABTY53_03005 [Streptomyces noursei]|uniref:hypothetical protein n=1 Tax=Streptomyces noursei TaxID=1971 RepID=UPI00332AC4E5
MQLQLPVQGVIDRSEPYEQFLVPTSGKDLDGTPILMYRQVGGYYGHDVGDPSPLVCRDPSGEDCRLVLSPAWGGLL